MQLVGGVRPVVGGSCLCLPAPSLGLSQVVQAKTAGIWLLIGWETSGESQKGADSGGWHPSSKHLPSVLGGVTCLMTCTFPVVSAQSIRLRPVYL